VKEGRKIDDHTVEFVTNGPDPILPVKFAVRHIMSKRWAEQHNVVQITSLARNEISHASNNANGTGPFRLRMHQADTRAEFEVDPNWWDKAEHNLTEVIFTPIANAASRAAALLSGEVDMVYTLPLSAVGQVQARQGLRVHQTAETRTMYFAYDMLRDELLDSDIKGRNPFKDIRVRQAMRIAIDGDAIQRTMPFTQYARLVSPPYETSFFYVGWAASTYDTHNTLLNLLVTRAPGSPRGIFNVGGYSNARVDQLTDLIRVELDQTKRNVMIKEALTIVRDEIATIPIIQQVIVWGAKDNIDLVQPADNYFPLRYVRVK
jgi:ABC-type transport system substrate-binding protein